MSGIGGLPWDRPAEPSESPPPLSAGGHRRFLIAAVQAMVPAGRVRRPALSASSDHIARAYRKARPLVGVPGPQRWLDDLSVGERAWFRERGTQLVADLLEYLDAERDQTSTSLRSAERHATVYGAEAARLGASLSDTVEGFLRFRKPFVDELAVLARRRRLDTREATDLLVDADAALDVLLLALMNGHSAGFSGS